MHIHWIANSRFVSLAMFLGLTVLISGNALFLQQSPHPAPLFFTRGDAGSERPAGPAPIPVARDAAAPDSVGRPKQRPGTESVEPERQMQKGDPVTLAIQQALADAAYGPLTVDGIAGQETADAIRRFQLDQGMSVSGQIDDELISRLVSVGAMAKR